MYIPEHTIPPTSLSACVPQWHRCRPSACHIRISLIYINFVCSPMFSSWKRTLECPGVFSHFSVPLFKAGLFEGQVETASITHPWRWKKEKSCVWIWCCCIAQSLALQFVLEKGFPEQRKMFVEDPCTTSYVCVLAPGAEVTCTAIMLDFVALSVLLWKSRVKFWLNMKVFPLMMDI